MKPGTKAEPTAAEIEAEISAIRERDATDLSYEASVITFTTQWSANANGFDCYGHALQLMRDRRYLLTSLDAANDKLKRAQSAIRFTLASDVYDFDLVEGCEALCALLSDEEVAHAETRQLWLKAKAEVEGVLSIMPPESVVRVQEGGGPENLWSSLAVSVTRLASKLVEVTAEWDKLAADNRDLVASCEVYESMKQGFVSANDRLQAESRMLRTCFCLTDDETVVSSVEGSILIDNRGGTRRRYFVATYEERKLKEQLDAMTTERDRLSSLIARDCISSCACCGVKLSWEWLGDATNAIEVETGKSHECQYDMATAPPGTYRHLEAERDKLRDAIRRAGFSVCQTSGDWTIHDVSELGKREQEKTAEVIVENMELSIENQKLRADSSELAAAQSREATLMQQRDQLQAEVFGWKRLVNRCERALGMNSFATSHQAGSVAEECSDLRSKLTNLTTERDQYKGLSETLSDTVIAKGGQIHELKAGIERLKLQLDEATTNDLKPILNKQQVAAVNSTALLMMRRRQVLSRFSHERQFAVAMFPLKVFQAAGNLNTLCDLRSQQGPLSDDAEEAARCLEDQIREVYRDTFGAELGQ